MNIWRKLQSATRALLRKPQLDADMNDEMRSHVNCDTGEHQTQDDPRGTPVRRAAAVWLDGIHQSSLPRATQRDGVGKSRRDIRCGARQLRKNPEFNTVAVLTLALGIGGCAAIYAAISFVLVAVAAVACLILALRAANADPMVALRIQ